MMHCIKYNFITYVLKIKNYLNIGNYRYLMKQKIRFLKALADETRMKIVLHLLDKEKCACTIYPVVGRAQSTVSEHLAILEKAGILRSRKVGKNIWYEVKSRKAREILKILDIKKI
ncbi:metalloregulator ArsR/SmtB family transcription factor [Candidatus Woesearchaeota archaeon]|nr:metalloregulator ArsR/SmtB family transcription factor [Candidatus Woesearchaeota archaeon]